MCVYSLVIDDFNKQFPNPWKTAPATPNATPTWPSTTTSTWPVLDLDRLEKLIKEFKEATALAEKLDALMKQPDCVDPEKVKLVARVAELEKELKKAKRANKLKNLKKPIVKKK